MIETIENGMGLAQVRGILNRLIERVNELDSVSGSYDDLENRPAINGVTLTSETTFDEFTIPASRIDDYGTFKAEIRALAEETAAGAAAASVRTKLDGNFNTLQPREYELSGSMLVVIGDDKGNAYKTTLGDLIDYLKREVLKLNDQYLRVIK